MFSGSVPLVAGIGSICVGGDSGHAKALQLKFDLNNDDLYVDKPRM